MNRTRACRAVVVACLLLIATSIGRAAEPGTGFGLQRVARWAHGPSFAVDAAADLLLVGEGSLLRVFDPSDPLHPVALGEVEVPGVIMEIDRAGDLAYLAAARGGLRIVDLSDPTAPVLRGGLFTPGTAYAVEVDGTRAMVADEDGGLRVFDVSDPDAPVELGAYATDLYAMDLDVVGSIVYVADMLDAALEVYDVGDPTAITLLGDHGLTGPPWGVSVDGSLAVVVDDYAGITTFDVSTPATPVETAHAWLDDVGYDVELKGTTAYVAEDWRGVSVFDLSSLPSISRVGGYDTPGFAFGLSVLGEMVYVADQHEGAWPIDLSDPTAPVVGTCVGPVGPLRRVFTEGGVGYAIDENHGLRILQPLSGGGALQAGAVELAGSPQDVDVEDGIAWVACAIAGVAVIDVADPRHPLLLRWIELEDHLTASRAMGLSVDGDRLGVVDETDGFHLFDVSDPNDPILLDWHYMGTYPRHVIVEGDYAYVAERQETIRILQLTPVLDDVGVASHVGFNYDLDKHGSILFVAKDWRGVWMIDVSDPQNPIDVYTFDPVGSATDLSISWPYLYVAEGSAVRAYDVGFPMDPQYVGEYVVDDVTLGVCATRQFVHVGGMQGGWYELENTLVAVGTEDRPSMASPLEVGDPAPNPFNPRSTLRFAIARSGPVRVSVVDVRGREIAVLLDAWREIGPHRVSWDGKDARGVGVASGVYRYRVEASGQVRTRGVVLVR